MRAYWVYLVMIAGGVALGVCPVGDLDGDCDVDMLDLGVFAGSWLDPNCAVAGCAGEFDGVGDVNGADFALWSGDWATDFNLPAEITWIAHASFRIVWAGTVIYIDPRNISSTPHDADVVLVTHSHGDHYSPSSIANVSRVGTNLVASSDVIASQGYGIAMVPGQSVRLGDIVIYSVVSYNTNKPNHPRDRNWLGFIIDAGPLRIYNAGDCDRMPGMAQLAEIDVAMLPVGGTYTMNAAEAAAATGDFLPMLAIPAHWGTSVGTLADAELFRDKAHCPVLVMSHGQTMSTDDPLPERPPDR